MITTNSKSTESATEEKPSVRAGHKKRLQGPRMPDGSRESKRLAAAILEVLGGVRMPSDAAKALCISLPRYYQLETRAMAGFMEGCEPRPIGRVRSAKSELASSQKEVQKLRQECARYSALVRIAQRNMGLSAPQPPKPNVKGSGKKYRKKATVRALKAAQLLVQSETSGEAEAVPAGEQPAKE